MSNTDISPLWGHRSQDTAHLTFAYPFGRARCLRREWIEQATQGSAKGRSRFVTQTTHKAFNIEYTDRIKRDGIDAANAWAIEALQTGKVRWNKPHPSTYYPVVVMVAAPLPDDSGRIGTDFRPLSPFPTLATLNEFIAVIGENPQFNETEARLFDAICRRTRAAEEKHEDAGA